MSFTHASGRLWLAAIVVALTVREAQARYMEWDDGHHIAGCGTQSPCGSGGSTGHALCRQWTHHKKRTNWFDRYHHTFPRSEFSHCECRPNFAGGMCDRCANGFVGFPKCISVSEQQQQEARRVEQKFADLLRQQALEKVRVLLDSTGSPEDPSLATKTTAELQEEARRLETKLAAAEQVRQQALAKVRVLLDSTGSPEVPSLATWTTTELQEEARRLQTKIATDEQTWRRELTRVLALMSKADMPEDPSLATKTTAELQKEARRLQSMPGLHRPPLNSPVATECSMQDEFANADYYDARP